MKEIIKIITTTQGSIAVSARDLHQFLIKEANGGQIGEMFSHWIKRILDYGFIENVDYQILEYDYLGNPLAKSSKSDNQEVRVHKRDYILTLDCAKQIAMIQNNNKGKEARLYFIECEKKLNQVTFQLPDFSNPAEAARAWAAQYEGRVEAEAKIIELQPKVEHYEEVMNAEGSYDLGDVAKMLGTGRTRLFEFLRNENILYQSGGVNHAYQIYIDYGYFEVIQTSFIQGTTAKSYSKIVATPKGVEFIRKRMKKFKIQLNNNSSYQSATA